MMPGPVQFSNPPPPIIPNMSVPPPMTPTGAPLGPPPGFTPHPHHFSSHGRGGGHRHFFQPFRPYPRPGPGPPGAALDEFDGKRLRKSVMRKTVDYSSAIIKALEGRVWQRDFRDRRALQPDVTYYPNLEPPPSYVDNPINSVVTRFVKTATNKMRCPIFCMAWTPEGRRLVTGASSGEFTLWNGLTFNFETILQAHDSPVRTMVWSPNDTWMVTGDHMGYVKYWQSNMNNVKMFQAHKEAIRGLSFSPTDQKFVTCSDDGTLRIWDFARCHEERILRGHGADVKCVHWHPQKSLIVSGSKDNQQPIKLWDPKSGTSLATLHAHKSTVMDIKWNANGNWLVTASRDHLLKLFDIRNLSTEVQTFRGHKKEASSVAWHPYHEGLFCSGGSDGAILFWHVGADKEVGGIEQAHDSIVWTLAWHPLGHILCSGSNDHTSKFWTRNRPGDQMRDKYNLNTLPAGLTGFDDQDIDDTGIIPGMGPEDKVEETDETPVAPTIPGLDFEGVEDKNKQFQKKVPYSKPIPRNFVAQWNETGRNEEDSGSEADESLQPVLNPIAEALRAVIENTTIPGCIPLSELQPQAIIMYGKILPVESQANSLVAAAIAAGGDALKRLVESGVIEEFADVMPHIDEETYSDYSGDEDNGSTMVFDRMDDIQLPAPLPSSIFAKKGGPVAQRKTRFSEPDNSQMKPMMGNHGNEGKFPNAPPPTGDQDMRSLSNFHPVFQPFPHGDQDLRIKEPNFPISQEDEDLRILRDIDLREEMMNNAFRQGPPGPGQMGPGQMGPGPMGPGSGPFRDIDNRIRPADGNWQQQQQQQQPPARWGPNDPIRPGLNNFGTRNFVSSGNFQNQGNFPPRDGSNFNSGNFPNKTDGSNGNNFGGPNPNAPGNFGANQNFPNDSRSNKFDDGDSQSGGSWPGGPNQGPPMGPRPNMGPRQMGPRQMGPGQQMGPRSGPPQMGRGHQMGPGGPMGPRGPMGGGPQMGPGGPMGGPQMGPGGPQVGRGSQMEQGGPPMGQGGPPMGQGGPPMGQGGPPMGQAGPPMGQGGPPMGQGGPMGPGSQGPSFQNQNPFFRGRGFRGGRGFDSSRGGFESSRGGFDSNRGGFDSSRGGFESSRGGFDSSRGGFDSSRGGFDSSRGGFDSSRGGFDSSRGGFEGSRGGFESSRGGFESSRGGFEKKRGGGGSDFDNGRGDFENNRSGFNESSRGGFDGGRGGFENKRGGFDTNRGGFDSSRGGTRGGPPRGRFSGSRGSRGHPRGNRPSREPREEQDD